MAFSQETFELLSGLADSGKFEYVKERKELFEAHVYEPFKRLFYAVRDSLPKPITSAMVVEADERALFSKLKKNDYSKGGAWSYYWGAIWVGEKRQSGVQLFLWINKDRLEAGFYIGDGDKVYEKRFRDNLEAGGSDLMDLLGTRLAGKAYRFGSRELQSELSEATWDDWRADPSAYPTSVAKVFSWNSVLALSEESLVEECTKAFADLFPLVIVGSEEEPMDELRNYLSPEGEGKSTKATQAGPQTLAELSEITGIDPALLQRWLDALTRKGQVVLYGPPGTGKTFTAKRIAEYLTRASDGIWDLVQLHPAYAYEDFIQGRRPEPLPGGGLHYPVVAGRFVEFCERARDCKGPCVLILDEMNRANLARVFGELMYLLEYRDESAEGGNSVTIALASSEEGNRFGIPKNVFILGTMNTADRSIALVDFALRRRFAFLELKPDMAHLKKFHKDSGFPVDKLIVLLSRLNGAIRDPHYFVGTSYFLDKKLAANFAIVWETEIVPYLQEYFIDRKADTGNADDFTTEKVLTELGI